MFKHLKRLLLFTLTLLVLTQLPNPMLQAQTSNSLNEGLVGYWSFDEGGGEVLFDRSVFSNDGLLEGPNWVNGLIEFGINFYGRDNFIAKIPDANSLDVNEELTLACWICLNKNLVEDSETEEFFAFAKPNTDVYALGINRDDLKANGHLNIGTTTETITSENAVPQNRWFHLTLSYDAETGDTKVYIDGLLDQRQTLGPGPIEINNELLYLGSAVDPQTNEPGMGVLPGILDEARIYERVLTPEEVARLATEPLLQPNFACSNCFSPRTVVDFINDVAPRLTITHEEFLRLLFLLSNDAQILPFNATFEEIVNFFTDAGVIPADYPIVAQDPISKGTASFFLLRALKMEIPLLDQLLITTNIKLAEMAAFEIAVREKLIAPGSADELLNGLDIPDMSFFTLKQVMTNGNDANTVSCASGKLDTLKYFFVPPADPPVPGS